MKILIIGGTGTIGKKVSNHLSKKHDVLIAGRTSGDISVDITEEIIVTEFLFGSQVDVIAVDLPSNRKKLFEEIACSLQVLEVVE